MKLHTYWLNKKCTFVFEHLWDCGNRSCLSNVWRGFMVCISVKWRVSHIWFLAVTCMQYANKCCDPKCFLLEPNLLMTANMLWLSVQHKSYVTFEFLVSINFRKHLLRLSGLELYVCLSNMILVFQKKHKYNVSYNCILQLEWYSDLKKVSLLLFDN